ncbi:MAG: hypothetical protein RBU37_15870 [Myxococcota bacterium]|nr:hypothetical protein [Myxococcota bacterium]
MGALIELSCPGLDWRMWQLPLGFQCVAAEDEGLWLSDEVSTLYFELGSPEASWRRSEQVGCVELLVAGEALLFREASGFLRCVPRELVLGEDGAAVKGGWSGMASAGRGQRLALCGKDGFVKLSADGLHLCSLRDGRSLDRFSRSAVRAFAVDAEQARWALLQGRWVSLLRRWRGRWVEERLALPVPGQDLCFCPSGELLVLAGGDCWIGQSGVDFQPVPVASTVGAERLGAMAWAETGVLLLRQRWGAQRAQSIWLDGLHVQG